jgi:alpha-tubulin suppressor-like RCC1 family protein
MKKLIINSDGQLGLGLNLPDPLGPDIFISTPTIINSVNENIIQISCGYYHCLFLSYNGNIYSFGRNGEGQLGKIYKNVN